MDEEQLEALSERAAEAHLPADDPGFACAELYRRARPRKADVLFERWVELPPELRTEVLTHALHTDPEGLGRLCAADRATRELCRETFVRLPGPGCPNMRLDFVRAAQLAAEIATDDPHALCAAYARRCWLYAFLDWRLRNQSGFRWRGLLNKALEVMRDRNGPMYPAEEPQEYADHVRRWRRDGQWSILRDIIGFLPEDLSLRELESWASGSVDAGVTDDQLYEWRNEMDNNTIDAMHWPRWWHVPSLRRALERWVVPDPLDSRTGRTVNDNDASLNIAYVPVGRNVWPSDDARLYAWGPVLDPRTLLDLAGSHRTTMPSEWKWNDWADRFVDTKKFAAAFEIWLSSTIGAHLPERCRGIGLTFPELFDITAFVKPTSDGKVRLYGALHPRRPADAGE